MANFYDQINRLAAFAHVPIGNARDEHERWKVYQRVVPIIEARAELKHALASEPEQNLASSVVVLMFDHLPSSDRSAWLNVLKPEMQEFSRRRLKELDILESSNAGKDQGPSVVVEDWSNWLQLRMAESAIGPEVLAKLADGGRTKAIRARARESLRNRRAEQ